MNTVESLLDESFTDLMTKDTSPRPKGRPFTAEERKARHRESMQRRRLAEKRSIEVKRVEVERLTRELENAILKLSGELKKRQSGDDQVDKLDKKPETSLWGGQSTAAKIVQQRYLSLVLEQETITEENRRLTHKFKEWQKFLKLLGIEQDRLMKDGKTVGPNAKLLLQDVEEEGRWVTFSEDEPVVFYQPIERNKCQELAFVGYQNMQEMLRGPGARTVHDEEFGWKVYFSKHEEDTMDGHKVRIQHRFTKRIYVIKARGGRITVDSLAGATWKIFNSPELYKQMYRGPRTSRVMQQVDTHTCVMTRTYPDETGVMRMRCVSLIVQVEDCVIDSSTKEMDLEDETRRRVTILNSILDPDQCFPRASANTSNTTPEWMKEGMDYISFTETDEKDYIDIEYGGLVNVSKEAAACTSVPLIVMGMGEGLMRWEQLLPCCWQAVIPISL